MFEKASYKDWIAQVQKYIKDQPLSSFSHEVDADISFQPFAHLDNTPDRGSLSDLEFDHNIGIWFDSKSSNSALLDGLMNGAQSIDISIDASTDVNALLSKVQLNYIIPIFRGEHVDINKYIATHYLDEPIKKVIFDHQVDPINGVGQIFQLYPNANGSKLEELTTLCQSYLESPIELPAFQLDLSNQFFLEIARLRALRIVIVNLKKQNNISGDQIEIIGRIRNENLEGDPNNALISQTSVAMASIIGGATITQLAPYGESKHQKLSLNIQNILHLESHLSQHKDPMGGSYFIEDLTDKIATKVWNNLMF